jgi:hypothetical protein
MTRKVTITVGGDVVEYETFMVRGGKAIEITDPEFLAGIQAVMDALRRPATRGPTTTVRWIPREEPPRFPMPDS